MKHDDSQPSATGGPDDFLDGFLAAARAAEPPVPADLLARVLADATAARPVTPAAHVAATARPAVVGRLWQRLAEIFALLGGPGAIAGLGTAGLAGLWIGLAPPDGLPLPDGLAFVAGGEAAVTVLDLYPAELEDWTADLDPDLLSPELP